MIIKQEIILADEDKYLLSKSLPSNPCYDRCDAIDRRSCCGCHLEKEYIEKVKPYKEAGIYEYAQIIGKIKSAKGKICRLQKDIEQLYSELPFEIKEILEE